MQTRKFMLAMIVGLALAIGFVGCHTTPPAQWVQQENHAKLSEWYTDHATQLRAREHEMRHLLDDYGNQRKAPVMHAKKLIDSYAEAAEEAEKLAAAHAEMQ